MARLGLQNRYTRQLLALKELEGSATTGGDVGEAVLIKAKESDGSGGVATTDNSEGAVVLSCIDNGLSDASGALENASISNTPIGPFQKTVLEEAITLSNSLTDSGPMSRDIQPSGMPSRRQPCFPHQR